MTPSVERETVDTIGRAERDFDEALAGAEGLVMVDFWAGWCGPCHVIAPVLDEVVSASAGRVSLMKINVDESPALAARYGIRSIPTVLFFKNGAIVDRVIGVASRAVLQGIVDARA